MKKTINRKIYNTETASVVGTHYAGTFGDPEGYEENLYKTQKGLFFLYGKGGEESKYPTEDIIAISAEEAEKWQTEYMA